MSETVDSTTGELVEAKELVKVDPNALSNLVKDADKAVYNALSSLDTLNWKDLKPNQMAVLLTQRPMSVSGGGVTYLNFRQALYFAVRCYELGVSPFSSSVWFSPEKFSVNLTLEGKREVARIRGIDLGPPKFEEIERKWEDLPKMTDAANDAKAAGFTKDIGMRCKIRVGDPKHAEFSEYTAWISEWYVSRSPVWKSKPLHMLQTRSCEKCISLALGTGSSDPVGNEPD